MVHGSPLNAPVITLGEKKSLFGEKAQANEYVSYALYYWPDPANPDGPYKPIDGKKNKRLRSMDDSGRMAAFISTVCSLGRQYKLDRDPQAASRAGQWLKAWFIAPATRMQPHLKYAQIRPGNRTEGGGGGIIDLYRIPEFLEALTALKCSNALTAEEWKQVDAWLNQYYTWLTTSRQGRHAHTCSNNHYLFYVAQCAHLASFLGRSHEAAQWLAEAANMDRHIAPDGSQPEELKRAEPWQYSVYTLQAWGYLVQIAERMGDKNTVTGKRPPASIQKAGLPPAVPYPSGSVALKGSRAGTPLPAI
ncbi:MAG: alginate lyase family protein [Akkermansia sp.]